MPVCSVSIECRIKSGKKSTHLSEHRIHATWALEKRGQNSPTIFVQECLYWDQPFSTAHPLSFAYVPDYRFRHRSFSRSISVCWWKRLIERDIHWTRNFVKGNDEHFYFYQITTKGNVWPLFPSNAKIIARDRTSKTRNSTFKNIHN